MKEPVYEDYYDFSEYIEALKLWTKENEMKNKINWKKHYEQVEEFQRVFGHPIDEKQITDKAYSNFRNDLLEEEVKELLLAETKEDALDAVVDIAYIHLGTLVGFKNKSVSSGKTLLENILHDGLDCKLSLIELLIYREGCQEVFEKAFDEVHRSNMAKLDENGKPIINGENGVMDKNKPKGKILKPKGWKPPNLKQFV